MSIHFRVPGKPGEDNALFVEVDSGQSVERILFDCGEGCVSAIPFADILNLDHLCFSHFHMDHVCGFDSVFRALFDRDTKPNVVWGPPGTVKVMHHRFQGFLWNLHENLDASWRAVDIGESELHTQRFELKEAFAIAHEEGRRPWTRTILEGTGFTLDAILLDHHTPSVAYVVREKPKRNIDVARLGALGLKPGPWMKALKEAASDDETLVAGGVTYRAGDLRERLIVESPGDSIAYLTDFLLDTPALERLSVFLNGCRTLVCESQYRDADLDLAKRHGHMTAVLAATLAQSARAEELILFHVSQRYTPDAWQEMLEEARAVFPNTRFPDHWVMKNGTEVAFRPAEE